MTADHPTREERYAAVIEAHRADEVERDCLPTDDGGMAWVYARRCECGWHGPSDQHTAHVAAALVAADPAPAQAECRCRIIGWTHDPAEPHIPAQPEWEQADDCPVHPLAPARLDAALSDDEVDVLARLIRPWTLCDAGGRFDHGSDRAARAVADWLAARAAQPVPAPEVSRGVAEACTTCALMDDGLPCEYHRGYADGAAS